MVYSIKNNIFVIKCNVMNHDDLTVIKPQEREDLFWTFTNPF